MNNMKSTLIKINSVLHPICLIFVLTGIGVCQDAEKKDQTLTNEMLIAPALDSTIFDDKMLLDGYAQRFNNLSKDILIEMLKDDTLSAYKMAAAVRSFKERFSTELFSREKVLIEKILLRRLNRDDSPFVQVEIMDTLCRMDRYRYFATMVPVLIQKLDHYNLTVNEIAFNGLNYLVVKSNNRPREARLIFEILRKTLFLTRKRLENITQPGPKLKQKLILLRWSIKVLGTQELKRLPKEVLNLL